MPSRDAIPLHRSRQAALIDTLDPRENNVDQSKGMATHLILGTGIRNDTCGHTHSDWFTYIEGQLYLQVPSEDECRKDTVGEVCGKCNNDKQKPWYPKTAKGEGRLLPITNYYHDYSSGEEKYFGLKDRVESYFSVSPPNEEDSIGYDMIQANGDNGVSQKTVNSWIREVCVEAGINAKMRERRLDQELEADEDRSVDEQIARNGKNDQGQVIPDVFAHDLRASYCTQLCRDPNPNYTKIKQKTGHENEETLYRYVGFAAREVDPAEDAKLF